MSERSTAWITVYEGERHESGWPPENALAFVRWLSALIESVPAEYREAIEIDIGSESYYDSDYPTIKVIYMRPETDAEWKARDAEAAKRRERQEQDERRELAALKAKYGG